jgi:hypothetical protein
MTKNEIVAKKKEALGLLMEAVSRRTDVEADLLHHQAACQREASEPQLQELRDRARHNLLVSMESMEKVQRLIRQYSAAEMAQP